jgi:hypothetical protein
VASTFLLVLAGFINLELQVDSIPIWDVKNAGFSPIMFGSECKDLRKNWEAEEFFIFLKIINLFSKKSR